MSMLKISERTHEPVWTKIPDNLTPKNLDGLGAQTGPLRQLTRNAHHYYMDTPTSQEFMHVLEMLSVETHKSFSRDFDTTEYPHPFPNYTLTFWVGYDSGEMMETTVIVDTRDGEAHASAVFRMSQMEPLKSHPPLTLLTRDRAMQDLNDHDADTKMRMAASRASWAYVSAFVFLLSKPDHFKASPGGRGHQKTFYKGKPALRYTPSALTFDLDAVRKSYARSSTAAGRAMGAHECRAHLCHNRHTDPECDHDWVRQVSERQRWTCSKCGGKRWHRKESSRGSGELKSKVRKVRIKKETV